MLVTWMCHSQMQALQALQVLLLLLLVVAAVVQPPLLLLLMVVAMVVVSLHSSEPGTA
jgi:hypothetical protein